MNLKNYKYDIRDDHEIKNYDNYEIFKYLYLLPMFNRYILTYYII